MKDVIIRSAFPKDNKQIGQLIYDTVRTINRKDYTQEQVEAWAPDAELFSVYEGYAFVADFHGKIIGFGNLTSNGYLHRLYVHKDFQGKKIGSLLLRAIEERARELGLSEMTTEASVTAKPFFLSQGWDLIEKQTKIFREVSFINFKMSKNLQ